MTEIPQFAPGYRTVDGSQLNLMVDVVNDLSNGTGAVSAATVAATTTTTTNLSVTGTQTTGIQTLAAAGTTIADAGLITGLSPTVVVTATTSAQGVRLPVAATGKVIRVYAPILLNTNVYPGTGATIGAAATNAAKVLTAAAGGVFTGLSATAWVVT